jgi:hypothetical protein
VKAAAEIYNEILSNDLLAHRDVVEVDGLMLGGW